MREQFVECKSRNTAIRHCPWATVVTKAEGGFMAFESAADYHAWAGRSLPSMRLEIRNVLRCKCAHCGHEWDAFKRDKKTGKIVAEKPERCSSCKGRSWDGNDLRKKAPYPFVPSDIGKVPQLRPADLLEAFTANKAILTQLIADLGPCDHPKHCVCDETAALAKANRQIDILSKLTK